MLCVQGSVCTVGVQPPAEGVDRVRDIIRAKKATHFHCALTRHLRCATRHTLLLLDARTPTETAFCAQRGGWRNFRD